ncbi:MAG: DUF3078 domain-containing protein [Ginsengibacter sp.]
MWNISMRMISFLLLNTFLICIPKKSSAQDAIVDELKKVATRKVEKPKFDSGEVWKTSVIFNLNVGQGSQSNWAAGGDAFSFSIGSYLGLMGLYKNDRYSWENTLDLNYGMVNTTSLGTRKNDDRIDLLSKIGYQLQPKLNLTGLFNFHSQFSKGYNYISKNEKELLSDFMSPGYFLLSIGLDYKPTEGLSIFLSPVTARWTIVNDDSLAAKGAYGVDSSEHVKRSFGAFATISYVKDITKTIKYDGRVDLFSNYEHNPQNVDIMFKNRFTGKFSKFLAVSIGLDLIYDDDIRLFGPENNSPALQLKSILAVGLTLKF